MALLETSVPENASEYARKFESKPGDVRNQINKLKGEIESKIASDSPPAPGLDLVLFYLRLAEESLPEKPLRNKDSKSWYDLVNAKMIYHQKIMPYFSGGPNDKEKWVRQEIERAWHELAITQSHKPEINAC